jgi:hypothetical protein
MSSITPKQEVECNKRLVTEVSEELGIAQSVTQHALAHFSDFIAATVQIGNLEGVYVPYLGKFHVKHKAQQYKNYLLSLVPSLREQFRTNCSRSDLKELLNPKPCDSSPSDPTSRQS